MTKTKAAKKNVTSKSSTSNTSHLNPDATIAPSPEVSAPNVVLVASAAAAAPPMTPPGDLPPAAGAPAPPEGWTPVLKKKRSARGLRPKGVQITSAVAAAKELTQSATYATDFGSRAPAAAQVAFVVTNAAKWRDTWQAAKKFFAYASEQRATWENDAVAQMDALKPAFDYAASRDTTVAEKYAATSKYLGATNAIAERAATVRKAKAKGGKGSTEATGAPPEASPPAPAPVAPETPAVTAK